MSYTKNVQTLRGIIKNNASHLSLSQLNELIKIVDTWIKEMPDIDDKGRFMADRKITLSSLLMKLNFIRMEKSVHKPHTKKCIDLNDKSFNEVCICEGLK